jgi:uncharacterized phiE125 gp8 family phage protein
MRPKRWELSAKIATDTLVVTVAEIKSSARMDASDTLLDTVIEGYIKAIQNKIERWAGLTLLKSRFIGYYDAFPVVMIINKHREISIEKIEYLDSDGILTTVDPLIYQLQKFDNYAKIFETETRSYPLPKCWTVDSVRVTAVAGWENKASVPDDIKSAISMSVIKMLQGDCGDNLALTKGAIELLRQYRNDYGWLE